MSISGVELTKTTFIIILPSHQNVNDITKHPSAYKTTGPKDNYPKDRTFLRCLYSHKFARKA
jgi:hypothetical protein